MVELSSKVLHDAGLPFQGASLLERDAARRLLRSLARRGDLPAAEAVRAAAVDAGWLEHVPESLGERELVRQTDLARVVALASAFDGDVAAFVDDLRRRFDPGGDAARGVHLLTLHRAKGLEFEAVFLPRVEAKELPSRQARTAAQVDEERRLLYVGLTRARRVLWVTWSGTPSPFLRELGTAPHPVRSTPRQSTPKREWSALGERLRAWRLERARDDGVPPYVVFHDSVLHEIADTRPTTLGELARVTGVGPSKLERYGDDVLAAVARGTD